MNSSNNNNNNNNTNYFDITKIENKPFTIHWFEGPRQKSKLLSDYLNHYNNETIINNGGEPSNKKSKIIN